MRAHYTVHVPQPAEYWWDQKIRGGKTCRYFRYPGTNTLTTRRSHRLFNGIFHTKFLKYNFVMQGTLKCRTRRQNITFSRTWRNVALWRPLNENERIILTITNFLMFYYRCRLTVRVKQITCWHFGQNKIRAKIFDFLCQRSYEGLHNAMKETYLTRGARCACLAVSSSLLNRISMFCEWNAAFGVSSCKNSDKVIVISNSFYFEHSLLSEVPSWQKSN